MIDQGVFQSLTPEYHCSSFASTVRSLARIGALALENTTSGIASDTQRLNDAATLLHLINEMMDVVTGGVDELECALKKGVYAPRAASTP